MPLDLDAERRCRRCRRARSKIVDVDNQQPTVSLTGPTDAPSTAGTQYVTATAAAGPSGVAGISCSVDNAPAQWYAGEHGAGPGERRWRARRAVLFGEQCRRCRRRPWHVGDRVGFTIKIGTPTVAGIAFSAVVDKLRCRKVTERVRIPARWVKGRSDGKVVRVREPAHTVKVRVTRCHPRTVTKRVTRTVSVRRGGKTVRVRRRETVRVVLEPHTVYKTSKRIGFGKATTVQGWLGTNAGVALGGQPVQVLTAADNGRNDYRVAATATTAADGSWSARLPAGPSRLVTVAYPGGPTTEGTFAAPVHVVVPARVQLLEVSPRRVAVGRPGPPHRTAQGRLSPAGRSAGAAADRRGIGGHDLRGPRARARQRPLHHDVPVRRRGGQRPPDLLVPDRIAADGRLPVRPGRQPAPVRPRRRASPKRAPLDGDRLGRVPRSILAA